MLKVLTFKVLKVKIYLAVYTRVALKLFFFFFLLRNAGICKAFLASKILLNVIAGWQFWHRITYDFRFVSADCIICQARPFFSWVKGERSFLFLYAPI